MPLTSFLPVQTRYSSLDTLKAKIALCQGRPYEAPELHRPSSIPSYTGFIGRRRSLSSPSVFRLGQPSYAANFPLSSERMPTLEIDELRFPSEAAYDDLADLLDAHISTSALVDRPDQWIIAHICIILYGDMTLKAQMNANVVDLLDRWTSSSPKGDADLYSAEWCPGTTSDKARTESLLYSLSILAVDSRALAFWKTRTEKKKLDVCADDQVPSTPELLFSYPPNAVLASRASTSTPLSPRLVHRRANKENTRPSSDRRRRSRSAETSLAIDDANGEDVSFDTPLAKVKSWVKALDARVSRPALSPFQNRKPLSDITLLTSLSPQATSTPAVQASKKKRPTHTRSSSTSALLEQFPPPVAPIGTLAGPAAVGADLRRTVLLASIKTKATPHRSRREW